MPQVIAKQTRVLITLKLDMRYFHPGGLNKSRNTTFIGCCMKIGRRIEMNTHNTINHTLRFFPELLFAFIRCNFYLSDTYLIFVVCAKSASA